MITLRFILMLLAFVCLLLSGLGVQSHRVNLFAIGMAFWALAVLIA